ncbi:MAG: DEAD/DEAH box helicase family protein [Ruminococcus sp.]|nr:DEAD/DEAH box helicase family protein [Ruminococcus sp.]
MARNIDSVSSKKIIKVHKAFLNDIDSVCNYANASTSEIASLSEALVKHDAIMALENIPIEELNRDKKGFRVKTLKDSGYSTIADIEKASASELSKINGISPEAASSIKKAASKIADISAQSVHLKLSADNKTPAATKLVCAVSKHISLFSAIKECRQLAEIKPDIVLAIKNCSPLTSGIKWLFASGKKKARAEESYAYLFDVAQGDSLPRASECASQLRKTKIQTKEQAWTHFASDPVPFFNVLEEICPQFMQTDTTVYGLPEELAQAIQNVTIHTEGLKCTLRRYQEWGVKYTLHQKRVLLGDEMGLGKTVQAIAVMVSLRNTGAHHFVVVCPASVITNWCREIEKMSDLPVTRVHGANREQALLRWKENGGVAVTTYETTEHFTLGEKYRFSALVVDEAHYIKNIDAQRSKNVRKICKHAENIMFMTGTALENKVSEMVSLMEVLSPSVAKSVHGMEFLSSAPEFREKIAPVYYRRRREDVLTELPELIENTDWCTMGTEEEKQYNAAVMSGNFANARRVSWNVSDLKYSSKANRLLEIVEDAQEEGRKVIVFSFFLDTIQKVTSLLGERCMEPINGSVAPQRRQEIIDEFDKAPAGKVLAAQIQSGGTGLNIQSASVVVLCEPQFKPSIENQAISRAYRMGQTRNVLVHRLLCDETVDERISELLKNKQEIFDAFADESAVGSESLEIDERTFGSIMEEEKKRIEEKASAGLSEERKTQV